MPINTGYFVITLVKLVIGAAVPIAAGIVTDVLVLTNTALAGTGTIIGVVAAGIVIFVVADRLSNGIRDNIRGKISGQL